MVELKEMSQNEFLETAHFSFNRFIKELAKSSGRSINDLKKTAGNPPTDRTENDLWRAINHDQKKIGYLWVQLKPELLEAFGWDIYIEKDFRGKGYGRLVMLEGKKLLQQKNIKKIKICVFQENNSARNLYSSLGFQVEKIDKKNNQHHLYLSF